MSESHTMVRKSRIRAGASRGKSQLHSEGRKVLGKRGKVSKENLHRRSNGKPQSVLLSIKEE